MVTFISITDLVFRAMSYTVHAMSIPIFHLFNASFFNYCQPLTTTFLTHVRRTVVWPLLVDIKRILKQVPGLFQLSVSSEQCTSSAHRLDQAADKQSSGNPSYHACLLSLTHLRDAFNCSYREIAVAVVSMQTST